MAHRGSVAGVPGAGGDAADVAAAADADANVARRRPEEIEGPSAVAARPESAAVMEEEDITTKSWCNRTCILYEPPNHTAYFSTSACSQSLRGPAARSQESITIIRARFGARFEGLWARAKKKINTQTKDGGGGKWAGVLFEKPPLLVAKLSFAKYQRGPHPKPSNLLPPP